MANHLGLEDWGPMSNKDTPAPMGKKNTSVPMSNKDMSVPNTPVTMSNKNTPVPNAPALKLLTREPRFAAALSGAHVGDPRCPATDGKGGECCCLELLTVRKR